MRALAFFEEQKQMRLSSILFVLLHYRKSSPIPTCIPLLPPSPLVITSGVPKLNSTRTGSNLYTRPNPADTEGDTRDFLTMLWIFQPISSTADKKKHQRRSEGWKVPSAPFCSPSKPPALRKTCILSGQLGLCGMFDMMERPADQYKSPPIESTP